MVWLIVRIKKEEQIVMFLSITKKKIYRFSWWSRSLDRPNVDSISAVRAPECTDIIY